jgi:hypothetical protein
MPDIISCPSCQRKLQVPETLLGQDVQCPTCAATFTAGDTSGPPMPPPSVPARFEIEREPPSRYSRREYDEEDYDEEWHGASYPRYRRDLRPHRGAAVLSLGIISLVGFLICGLVPLICGPLAWIMGQQDLNEMRAGRMDRSGEGQTNAGRICGMIASILCIVAVILVALFFFLSISHANRGRF